MTLSEQQQQQQEPNQQEHLQRDKNTIPIKDIIIKERYRKEIGDIDILADNISQLGLLQPVVINENNELIDGQRRILAFEKLGKSRFSYFLVLIVKKVVLGEFS